MLRRIFVYFLLLILLVNTLPALETTAQAAALPFYITVDLTNQIVTIYSASDNSIVRQMLCSSGLRGSTPTGTFTLPEKERSAERTEWYFFNNFQCYAKYATRIYNGIMFHSIPYNSKRESSISKTAVSQFGQPASHGCIRLRVDDAKFIAKYCLPGTKVKIYKSNDPDVDLRALLMESSYSALDGMSYNSFLGIPDEPGVLGRYSSGSDVRDLQYRLRALGFFTDTISGEYHTSTVNAIKQVQKELGLEQNGYATTELLATIYSYEAPTSTNVTLSEGMSGPSVRNLQSYLQSLLLYSGEIDSIYDYEVIEAVKRFQTVYGYTADGIATGTIQKALYYESGKLLAYFNTAEYTCEYTTEAIPMVTVSAKARVRIRSKPSTDSTALDRVADGTVLILIEKGSTWSKVRFGSTEGYIMNTYLKYTPKDLAYLKYTAVDDETFFTIGNTAEDYASGASLPCDTFATYLANNGSLEDYEGIADYATVNTGADGLKLNLRSAPSTAGEVIAELENGFQVEVLLKTTVWSLVAYGDVSGYLMSDYLSFWTGPEGLLNEGEEEDAIEEDDFEGTLYALVYSNAYVYNIDSEDAEQIGKLAQGIQVEVIESDDAWSLIQYQGHQGYMHNEDLQFILTEDFI